MNKHTIELYLGFKHFNIRNEKAGFLPTDFLIREFNMYLRKGKVFLFAGPGFAQSELTTSPELMKKSMFEKLLYDDVSLRKKYISSFRAHIEKINDLFRTDAYFEADKSKLQKDINLVLELATKSKGIKSFNKNILKTAAEIILLRVILSNSIKMINKTLECFSPLVEDNLIDFQMIYKLTRHPRFHDYQTDEQNIWDRLAEVASQMPKKLELGKVVTDNPILGMYLLEQLDLDKISNAQIQEIIQYFREYNQGYNIYKVINELKFIYHDFLKSEYKYDVDARRAKLEKLSNDMEEAQLKQRRLLKVLPEDERNKYLVKIEQRLASKKIAMDDCPLTLTAFISYDRGNSDDEKALVQLSPYQMPTLEEINKKVGATCIGQNAYRFYDRLQLTEMLSRRRTQFDPIDRTVVCKTVHDTADKISEPWLKIFCNIRQLQDLAILNLVSDKWFEENRLKLLVNLQPELLQPRYLMFIEQIKAEDLNIELINDLNKSFMTFLSIPLHYQKNHISEQLKMIQNDLGGENMLPVDIAEIFESNRDPSVQQVLPTATQSFTGSLYQKEYAASAKIIHDNQQAKGFSFGGLEK